MKCFLLGHKFGKIHDKYQYCAVCGIARPIHPCAGGHFWKDTGENNLVTNCTTTGDYGVISTKTIQVPQKCSCCGERRSVQQH